MPTIRRLPPDVASRIAAGEVIERPASVLKELLENSLDAGATKVQIESAGAGRGLLRVVDDGRGMDAADCRLAFDRHATSKIAALEDLDSLSTFGFRGEALFSIAAVSRVSVSSCLRGSSSGYIVEAEGGRVVAEHEAPAVAGTSVAVRDLFFNTPARAKFLKSEQSEKGHLTHVVEEAALANPAVAFAYKSENRTALRLPACEASGPEIHRRRIAEILGEDLAEGLLCASETRGGLKVVAFLAPVGCLSASRALQFSFVNRRPVTSRLVQQALYRAYEPFRSRDRHPVAVIFLELPPDQCDVNVHPAKREVRFRQERAVFDALASAFSAALLRSKGIPTIDAAHPPLGRGPIRGRARSGSGPWLPSSPAAAPDASGPRGLPGDEGRATRFPEDVREESPTYGSDRPEPALPLAAASAAAAVAAHEAPRWFTPPFAFLGQIERSYLVFDAAGGLLVVDQHAAQERVLFERYLRGLEADTALSQPLMLPIPLELPASRVQRLLGRADRLKRLGVEVEAFGHTTLRVVAAPPALQKAADLREMLHRLLESVESEGRAAKDVLSHAAATVACKAAVKAHDRLGNAEALRLLEELRECSDPTACPHGRPSMIALSRDELAHRFKRPGAPPL